MVCKATFHFFFTSCSPVGRSIFEIFSWKKTNLHLSGVPSGSYFFSKFLFLFSVLDSRLLSIFFGQIFYWIASCFYVEPGVHKWLTSICQTHSIWADTLGMICTYMASQDYPVYTRQTLYAWRYMQSNAFDILKMKNGRCK